MSFFGYVSEEARQQVKQKQIKRRAEIYQEAYDSYIKMGFSKASADEYAIQSVESYDRQVQDFEMFYG